MRARVAQAVIAALLVGTSAIAQPIAPGTGTPPTGAAFEAGRPLGVTIEGKYAATSANVKVYGAVVSAESCAYDVARGLILIVNRGANQNEVPNDGFVSLINHDGSVHTARWIGANRNGLVLNHPFGSDVHAGKLYLADSDGGTADGAPRVAVLRMFDMITGAPAGEIAVPQAPWLNDIAATRDGTIYASQTGSADGKVPMRIYRIGSDGRSSVFLEGAPLSRPNGVAIDNEGNIVVANMGDTAVMTFSPIATLLKTEHAAQAGSDGLVIMRDGTKYLSSVVLGGISKLRPGRAPELIAAGIPNAASMCYDSGARQLVVPLNANNGIAFVKVR